MEMDREYIESKVIEIIKGILDDDINISMDSSFIEDLDIVSIEVYSMIIEIEDEFDVKIPEKTANKFAVVGDLVDYLAENVE